MGTLKRVHYFKIGQNINTFWDLPTFISELFLTHCVAAHCHMCAKRPWEMFSSLQSLDLLMPTGFFFHWPRLLSKYELRIVRVPFTVILNDAWLDRKFHFSCIVIVDIKFQNNYSWKVSGLIMWMPGSLEPLVNTTQRECVRIPEVWLHTNILRQLFCSNNDVRLGRGSVQWL